MDYHSEQADWAGIVCRALAVTDPSTDSPAHFAKSRPVELPTTVDEANALREWALSSPPRPAAAATSDELARHLEFMHAALPSRANDAETGRKRFAVYASILAGRSNASLAFMARRACETLDWFPSPKQCLDILDQYRSPESPQAQALLACRQFTDIRFGEWLNAIRAGGPVGDVPDHWKRVAVEQGDVRRLDDGSYVSRLLYHGPPRPPYKPAARAPAVIPPVMPFAAMHPYVGEPGASAGLI